MNQREKVEEFHRAMRMPIGTSPRLPIAERAKLRYDLIDEEASELWEALQNRDIVETADALGDLLYVVLGAAIEFGIPIDDVFDEIHRSNMSKLWSPSDITTHSRDDVDGFLRTDGGWIAYRADGKILKPPSYSPPELSEMLRLFPPSPLG